jgi:phosphoenolpyruvate carboxylase
LPQLHYIISSVASNLMLADADLMRRYADLVTDEAVRGDILARILDELERTRTVFEVIYGGPLVERRPNVSQIIRLRREPLATLHARQIDLLRRWRQLATDDPRSESVLLQLLLSVNAIANGLGTTG